MMRAAVALALLVFPTCVHAFSDQAYCLALAKAARQRCHAEHQLSLADCADDYAWNRWAEMPSPLETVTACRQEADEACAACRAEVDTCE